MTYRRLLVQVTEEWVSLRGPTSWHDIAVAQVIDIRLADKRIRSASS